MMTGEEFIRLSHPPMAHRHQLAVRRFVRQSEQMFDLERCRRRRRRRRR
jgi:hypothetical protein